MKQIINQILKIASNINKIEEDYIPEDSGLQQNVKTKNINFSKLFYFGNCIDTVDGIQQENEDGEIEYQQPFWDTGQMLNTIRNSVVIPTENVLKAINSNDIPDDLNSYIHSSNDLTKKSNIVCGYNQNREIVFVYISEQDIHYFFQVL